MQYIPENPNYTIITKNLALGNINSPYDPFDVIVNLAYPDNNIKKSHIHMSHTYPHILRVGIYDDPTEPMVNILESIIPKLIIHTHLNPEHKILIHCHAGISRSTTICIAYLCKLWNLPLRNIYDYVKSLRPIIEPNPGFMDSLKYYLNN